MLRTRRALMMSAVFLFTLAWPLLAAVADTTPPTTPMVTDDGVYTRRAATLHFSWTPATDPESPVTFYRYHVRVNSPTGAIIVPATQVTDVTEVTRTGLALQQGKTYFIGVRAFNSTGLGSGFGFADGITVDTTAPISAGVPSVPSAAGGFDADGNYTITWAAGGDSESGVRQYKVQERIGPTGAWMPLPGNPTTTSLAVTGRLHNTQYSYRVRTQNGAKIWSAWTAGSTPVLVDTTAPTTPAVTDDGIYTNNAAALHFSWTPASDAESGVAFYRYHVRADSVNGPIIVRATQVTGVTEVTRTGLALQSGKTHFIGVRAFNGAGVGSVMAFSDGIKMDATAPSTPAVTDDGATTGSTTQLHATWTASSDAESGVVRYDYQIRQDDTAGALIRDWTSAGAATAITATGLTLTPGKTYFMGVRAANGAGLVSPAAFADGILVQNDTAAPTGSISINGGATYAADSSVTLTLTATDNSGAVAQMAFSNDNTTFTPWEPFATSRAWTLAAGEGARTAYVKYRDTAGNTSVSYSDSITVDTTPPTAPGTPTEASPDQDGDPDGAYTVFWAAATDTPSGIASYELQEREGLEGTWVTVNSAVTTTSLALTGRQPGVRYYYRVRATNRAGWVGPFSGVSDGMAVDNVAPSGTMVINNDAPGTASTSVTLTLAATDDFSGVSQMRFSNTGSTYSAWEAYNTTKTWTLTTGAGTKTVYVQFRDVATNMSAAATDTILLDTTAPTPAPVVTDDGATTSSSIELHAAWTASGDPESGIARYEYQIRQGSTSGTIVRDWTSAGTATEVTATGLSLTNGTAYYLGVRAVNGAGAFSGTGFSNGITVVAESIVDDDVTVDTVWTAAMSPYHVTSYVRVRNGAKLTIQPGVLVQFDQFTGLEIGSGYEAGILDARGTASLPIRFTSATPTPAPGQWYGLLFSETTPASIIERAVVEYGGYGGANIRILSSTPTIRSSTIQFSSDIGISAQGGSPILESNTVSDSATVGVWLGWPTSPARPIVQGNTIRNSGSYPLRVQADNFPLTFTGNVFTTNGNQQVQLEGGGISENVTLPNPGIPYRVTAWVDVSGPSEGAPIALTIAAGTTLKFDSDMSLTVGYYSPGVLQAVGTAAQPITFTTSSASPAPGQWQGLKLYNGHSRSSTLDYCVIEYGGGDADEADLYIGEIRPIVRHTTLRHSANRGLRLNGSFATVEHNTITTNARGIVVSQATGAERIAHNTITGNSVAGFVNEDGGNGVLVNLNWWGSATGPAGAAGGTGNAATGVVMVEPWLTAAPSETLKWLRASQAPDPMTQAGGLTTFFAALNTSASWSLTIKNSSNTTVRTYSGSGATIAQDWPGTNGSGVAQPNGTYTYTLAAGAAAAATGKTQLDNTLPISNITAPLPDTVNSGVIQVTGTATATNLESWTLEYGAGAAPVYWSWLASDSTPISNGVLASWDTWSVQQPVQTLRLTVTTTTGKVSTDTVTIRILNLFDLYDTPDIFSPNQDAVQDTTLLQMESTMPVNWTLNIRNSGGSLVKSYNGTGWVAQQVWDGTGAAGVVPDGVYTYQFQATEPGSGVTDTTEEGTVTLDATPPTASFLAPAQGQTILTDDPLPITGTAEDATFWYYAMEYGLGSAPSSFTYLGNYYVPVAQDVLHALIVRDITPDLYTLRLTVFDAAGNQTQVTRQVTLDYLTVTNVSVAPGVIDPYNSEQAQIQYTLNRPANVTLRIYDDLTKQAVRTLVLPGQPAGARTAGWDGRNNSNRIVPLEAYYFTIQAADVSGRAGGWNDAATPLEGPNPSNDNPVVDATDFDPYRNDQVTITWDVTFAPERMEALQIWDANSISVRTLFNQKVLTPGPRVATWDGRRDDGSMFAGAFNVWFGVPQPLPLHTIIVRHDVPAASALRAEAFVVLPVFGEVSTLVYTLPQSAQVSIEIADPNGNSVRILQSGVLKGAGTHTMEWDGRTNAGAVVAEEGTYAVTLTLQDPATGLTSVRRGAVTVYR